MKRVVLLGWVKEEAKKLGVKPPKLKVIVGGQAQMLYGKDTIEVPLEYSEESIRTDIRHELAHKKLHTALSESSTKTEWESLENRVVRELEAIKLAEGKIGKRELFDVIEGLIKEGGYGGKKEVFRVVSKVAKTKKVSPKIISNAKKFYNAFEGD